MPKPLYRFWGRTPPADDRRAVVRAEVSATESSEATLYLYGPIDSWGGMWGISAAEVATALSSLPSGTSDLTVRINSPGGEVFEAVAIMNLLRDHSARITARVDGLAASAASFLAVSADETVMGGNTELMIHDAWGLAIGNAGDMRQYADLLDRTSDDIAAVYARKAGGGTSKWRDYMVTEAWFSAEEAVELGLADSINLPDGEDETAADPAARMQFDTAALFAHKDRTDAPPPAPLPDATTEPDTAGLTRAAIARYGLRARTINTSGHHARVVHTPERN